jgi:hypothetical protein
MGMRNYNLTDLPTMDKDKGIDKNKEVDILKEIYNETNSNYRNLADIRFKLLGFVPAISVLAWTELYKNILVDTVINTISGMVITMLGLSITYGIRIYDNRNNELYNDLVSRARKIEDELGIHTGNFRGRLEANKKDVFGKTINHGRALNIIYLSVFIGWGLLMLWYLGNLIKLFPLS